MAKEIIVLSENERDKLQVQISMCLQILYNIEDITNYKEKVISDCINFLQDLNVVSAKDIANDIIEEIEV